MKLPRFVKPILATVTVAGLAFGGYMTRETWLAWFQHSKPSEPVESVAPAAKGGSPSVKVIVTDQAQKNLGLTTRPLKPQTFWRTIQIPGMVVERPGRSEREVVAPATGVVTRITHLPGDTVRAGDLLFTLRLVSETLHQTQSDLFKAAQDIKLEQAQRKRFESSNVVSESRLIELDNQIRRLEVVARSRRLELLSRGFSPAQIDNVAEGRFVTEMSVAVPARPADASPTFEIQELKVELGQQVQVGQTLSLLANHQALVIEGLAFRDEAPLLEQSVKEKWPVEVDFQEESATGWPNLDREFRIYSLVNSFDPVSRTFAFFITLDNQSRSVEVDGRTQMLWRFRPGQKVRLLVRVEQIDKVFVLPPAAVAREGAEAFVFTQNVNTFERKSVRVLLQDRQHVVVANDGSLLPGEFVAQTAAASLNRMVRAGSSGVPKGYHIHADGSLHKNEDEGK